MQQQPMPKPPSAPGAEADPRAGIEQAMAGLENLDQVPPAEHVERFETIHSELTSALSAIDRS